MDRGERTPTALDLLRRAEQAMNDGRSRQAIQRMLEQVVAHAESDPSAAHMAHRHLGEILLEASPWNASLHLRRAAALAPHDDAVHALMGLAQSLLGNFRVAVASYRRALAISPRNPWYNHNLGHLLDVALGASSEGLPYLERAHKAEPSQQDVIASLAHCLGRLGQCDRALELARVLVRDGKASEDRVSLVRWLENGAPDSGDDSSPGLLSDLPPAHTSDVRTHTTQRLSPALDPRVTHEPEEREITLDGVTKSDVLGEALHAAGHDAVESAVIDGMREEGRSVTEIVRACSMWHDYVRAGGTRLGKPETFVAAIEYALARLDGAETRQRDIAARHKVSVSSLQNRYATLRATLNLRPRDPRYARR